MPQDFDAIVGFTAEEFDGGINVIFFMSMAIIPFNMAGSLYVLYRVLQVAFRSRPRAIPVGLRLPFYIVFVDLLCSITFTAEMIHLYIARHTPEPPVSHILGGCVTFVIISNFVLISQAAFNNWSRVVRKKYVDTGPYEWKLLLPTLVVPSVVVAVFAYMDALGSNNYFSWIRKSAQGPAVFVGVAVLASMFAIWYFYVSIMIEIFKVSRGSFFDTVIQSYRPTRRAANFPPQAPQAQVEVMDDPRQVPVSDISGNQRSGNSSSSQLTVIEKQAVVKICMYMLACFIQYLPGCPYALSFLAPTQPFVLYCLAIVSINSGGIVNATALILNEGFSSRERSSTEDSSTAYYPDSYPSAGESRSFGFGWPKRSYRAADTGSWGRVPSFRGILSNPVQLNSDHRVEPSVVKVELERRQGSYQVQPVGLQPGPLNVTIPKFDPTSYDSVWNTSAAVQPQRPEMQWTPTIQPINRASTAWTPSRHAITPEPQSWTPSRQPPNSVLVQTSNLPGPAHSPAGPAASRHSRRGSEPGSPATVVELDSNDLAQAYAATARNQQRQL
ncbi:hypothetical protein BJ742DRAFT_815867 [Cladochytrium replicatum]|nr:hypothetical protein BJ742DRAFT_815867 [Cladochytrium replicatum]